MPTEKQKASSRRWNSMNTAAIAHHRQQKAQAPKDSWWTALSAPTGDRTAFQAAIDKRHAERLSRGSDFASGPQRAI